MDSESSVLIAVALAGWGLGYLAVTLLKNGRARRAAARNAAALALRSPVARPAARHQAKRTLPSRYAH